MTFESTPRTARSDGLHGPSQLDRRAFLRIGGLGASGLGLAGLLRHESQAKGATARAGGRPPSVIILWMRGGPSHIDMWDPKPDAPVEFRGEFGTIPTTRAGHPPDRHAAAAALG